MSAPAQSQAPAPQHAHEQAALSPDEQAWLDEQLDAAEIQTLAGQMRLGDGEIGRMSADEEAEFEAWLKKLEARRDT